MDLNNNLEFRAIRVFDSPDLLGQLVFQNHVI